MKKLLVLVVLLSTVYVEGFSQTEYKVITVIESIVPGGLGRSRLIENTSEVDIEQFTTERVDGKKSDQGSVKRKDAKIDELNEAKLLNFYSLAGINFQNIASNDALITSKMNQLANDGWELAFVTSAAESDAGKQDGNGIYITRFVFKR